MKRLYPLFLSLTLLVFSCSGSKKEEKKETPSVKTTMKQGTSAPQTMQVVKKPATPSVHKECPHSMGKKPHSGCPYANRHKGKAKVFFTKSLTPEAVVAIYDKIKDSVSGKKIGFKVHFGEDMNVTAIKASFPELLVKKLGATLIETNVLYVGKRRYTKSHIALAKRFGWTYAPIHILDSDGQLELPVNFKHYKNVRVGKGIDKYDSLVIFSHFKGHGSAGFGGAIKNVSMGLASIGGKMALHATGIPKIVNPGKCIKCKKCVKECPVDAITLDPLKIDKKKCIGCGSCIGVCPLQLFQVPWESTKKNVFHERLIEYAKAISMHKNMVYINVLKNITRGCDCKRTPQIPFTKDIGILASTDMVAIDKASFDLVNKQHKCEDAFKKETGVSPKVQFEYAKIIKLGTAEYELISID
ncbi:DUF362 domain-containing protein [Myxococcota bacterium]|nr:DUF362 domain-containing protein [Myxococcota bacterium]MBU1535472.1 DUF362 domain-containing protein [Myxococcota bacterium]